MSRNHVVFDQIEKDFPEHVEELQRYIQQPSVSAEGLGVREMAEMVATKIKSLGATCKLVETGGYPIVYGYLDAQAPRTILFYELYDVQPASDDGWISPPFAGEIAELPDHGSSVIGRGAFNSKGCLAGFLNVLDAFKKSGENFPVNVIFMIEGEEEIGSVHLPSFIETHYEELVKADCVFQPYFGEKTSGKTVISLGFKGLLYLELTCTGGEWGGPRERDIHAMNNAWIANPAWRLVQALATMKGKNEETIIPGFYDEVALPGPEELMLLKQLEKTFDPNVILHEQGAVRFKWDESSDYEVFKKGLYEPSLNIDGIYSGYSGSGIKTIIPHEAKVKIDIRLVPGMKPENVVKKLRKHLDEQGYPDISIQVHSSYPASQTRPSEHAVQALVAGAKKWSSGPVEVWPFYPGAAPHYLFSDVLGLPVAFGGLGHGGRAHSTNEYVTVEGLKKHEQGIAEFLLQFRAGK